MQCHSQSMPMTPTAHLGPQADVPGRVREVPHIGGSHLQAVIRNGCPEEMAEGIQYPGERAAHVCG